MGKQNIINVNPTDLIFVNYSKFVITSMFHGVMLSYKFKKQFWYSEDTIEKISWVIFGKVRLKKTKN